MLPEQIGLEDVGGNNFSAGYFPKHGNNVPNIPKIDPAALANATTTLDDVLSRCSDEPGLLGSPEFIEAARVVHQSDSSQWFALRQRIKEEKPSGVPLKEIESLIGDGSKPDNEHSDNTAALLIKLAESRGKLIFDAEDGDKSFLLVRGEAMLIGSKAFAEWLAYTFYSETKEASPVKCGSSASDSAIKQAVATLTGLARYEGAPARVHLRAARADDAYYIGLADDSGGVVEVRAGSWCILRGAAPVKFWKPANMSPLPTPISGGKLDDLWRFANIPECWRLLVLAWMLEAWRPDTPFPVLQLTGGKVQANQAHKPDCVS